MFTAKSVWGIDIGDSCIKAVRLSAGDESITVEDFDYVEFDAEVKKKEGYLGVLADAVEALVARKEFDKTEVCISISAKRVNNSFIPLESELKPKEFKEEVKAEAEKQIPFSLDEVEWGYHQFPDKDDQSHIGLFAVRSEHISEILDIVDNAGLKVRGVQVPGVALYNFVTAIADVEEHMVVLDVGEKTTDLLMIYDDAFWLRSLPLSGSHITELLEKKFRITTKEANTLKHEMEKSNQKEKLFRVIEPKLKELVGEIKRSLNFRKTQVKDLNPTKFVAFGGSSQLPGAASYFATKLKLEEFKIDFGALDFDECEGSEQVTKNIASYGVAFGLAIQGIGPTKAQLNLIPKKYLLEKLLKSKRLTAIVANIAFFLMVLFLYISGSSTTTALDSSLSNVKDAQKKMNDNIGNYEDKVNKLAPMKADVEYYLRLQKGNKYIGRIYNELCELVNKTQNVYLVDITIRELSNGHLMENVDTVKYNNNEQDPKKPELESVEVSLSYVGEDAKANRAFYDQLLSSPMFKSRKGEKVTILNAGGQDYVWEYQPKLTTTFIDPFIGNGEVAAMRRELEWELKESKPIKTKYSMDKQVLRMSVNKAYLYNEEEPKKE